MDSKVPNIQPIKLKEFEVKQSKYEMVPKLPMRSIILGPSGSGKTILLQNMILDIYKNCFSRIYIFSPSIDVDATWRPVKKYIEEEMKVQNTKEEPLYFDHYDPETLHKIIDTQHKVIDFMKKKNLKTLYSILVVVDDFADSPEFSRRSKILHAFYTRGRHNSISTITATQKFSAIAPIIRVNATELYIYRLRNYKDLETFIDEVSAVADKKTLMQIYTLATTEPYSFLYVNLRAKKVSEMFHVRFDKKIEIESD
jgi:ABC-type cobalamin/Fe3+-siderophores transport system ATPase subunit